MPRLFPLPNGQQELILEAGEPLTEDIMVIFAESSAQRLDDLCNEWREDHPDTDTMLGQLLDVASELLRHVGAVTGGGTLH